MGRGWKRRLEDVEELVGVERFFCVELVWGVELVSGVELGFDAGDALVDDCDRFHPGFKDFGGIACVEGARMRQFGGIVALRFFESLLKVGEALFEIFLAHCLKVHRVCVMCAGSGDLDHPFKAAGGDFGGAAEGGGAEAGCVPCPVRI